MYLPPCQVMHGSNGGIRGALGSQIFNVLKAVAQVAKEGMIEVFQHPPLSDDIPYTLGPYHCTSC